MVNKAQPMRIGVIGSGSWATALVKLFSNNQSQVNWWVRSEESIAHIQAYKHNPRYLQSAELEVTKLRLSASLQEVISSSDYLIIAVPAAFIHGIFKEIDPAIFQGKIVISAVKGIIPEFNAIPARYFHKTLPEASKFVWDIYTFIMFSANFNACNASYKEAE
jgi:glycerol-3-phosphate dehydrogenase (NAD(P)+)